MITAKEANEISAKSKDRFEEENSGLYCRLLQQYIEAIEAHIRQWAEEGYCSMDKVFHEKFFNKEEAEKTFLVEQSVMSDLALNLRNNGFHVPKCKAVFEDCGNYCYIHKLIVVTW